MLKRINLVFLLAAFTSIANASNSEGEFAYYAHGTHSCGKFIEAVNRGNNEQNWIRWNSYLAYTYGYFTGYNLHVDNTYDIKGQTDMDGIMAFIEKHCRENPLDDYFDAIVVVTEKLHPNRAR